MGVRNVLARLAGRAAVPVFTVAGAGAREAIAGLRRSPTVELVDTPAAASILLVVGFLPPDLAGPLSAVHDAMPDPRCTVSWPIGADHGSLPVNSSRLPDHVAGVRLDEQRDRSALEQICQLVARDDAVLGFGPRR